MKRIVLPLCAALTLSTTPVFAAKETAAPALPSDLETSWMKTFSRSCKLSDGSAIADTFYQKNGNELNIFMKNGMFVLLVVVQPDDKHGLTTAVFAKQNDGNWMRYDTRLIDDGLLADEATTRVLGLLFEDYLSCAMRQSPNAVK